MPGNFTPSLYLLFYHNIQPKETLLLQNIAKEIVDSIKLKRELSKSTNPIRLSLERNAEYMSENEYIQARAYLDNLEMQRLFDEECIE